MDAMLEDLLSGLLSEATAPAALRRLRGLWASGLPLRACCELPQQLVRLADAGPREQRLEALAALAEVAQDVELLLETRALPLCVALLQSSDEALREQACKVLETVRQQGEVF